jgi:hypothetical protein
LILLTLAVALSQFAAASVERRARERVPALVPRELAPNEAPVLALE